MIYPVIVLSPLAGIATIAILLIREAWLWANGTLAAERRAFEAEQENWKRQAREAEEARIAEQLAAPVRWQAALASWDRSPPGRKLARLQAQQKGRLSAP
jgi:hypothetical protein